MSEIIHRLIRDGKVVGYQKQEGGKTWRTITLLAGGKPVSGTAWCLLNEETKYTPELFYIPHDRKDRFTGVTLEDGTKVFERDEMGLDRFPSWKLKVELKYGRWILQRFADENNDFADAIPLFEYKNDIKHIGIQGVKE